MIRIPTPQELLEASKPLEGLDLLRQRISAEIEGQAGALSGGWPLEIFLPWGDCTGIGTILDELYAAGWDWRYTEPRGGASHNLLLLRARTEATNAQPVQKPVKERSRGYAPHTQQILDGLESGLTHKEVADLVGVPISKVHNARSYYGLPPRVGRRPYALHTKKILDAIAKGHTPLEAAKLAGVKIGVVRSLVAYHRRATSKNSAQTQDSRPNS